jgi:hypothetical protein
LIDVPGFALQVLQFFCGLFCHAAANHTSSRAPGSHPLALCRPCAASPVGCLFPHERRSSAFSLSSSCASRSHPAVGSWPGGHPRAPARTAQTELHPVSASSLSGNIRVLLCPPQPVGALYLSDLDLELFARRRPKAFASFSAQPRYSFAAFMHSLNSLTLALARLSISFSNRLIVSRR